MSAPRFHPLHREELQDEAGRTDPAELTAAMFAGHELEKVASDRVVRPSDHFVGDVWAAIEEEPLPAPATAARHALRQRRARPFLATLGDAWRVASGSGRPAAARTRAFALLLAAALVLATIGGAAAAGAARVLVPPPAPTPAVVPTPPVTPPDNVEPSPSEIESPEPSESPGESETPEPSAGETSGSGQSGSGDGSGNSGSGRSSPDASGGHGGEAEASSPVEA